MHGNHLLWGDLKHAIRRLARDWQFALSAVLILTLGIGVNTAIFSVVNALLFRKQPFPNSDRLVNLYQNVGDRAEPTGVSFPTYRDIAASADVFSAAAAVLPDSVMYQGSEDLRFAIAEYVTSHYLDVAGYRVTAGRWFTAVEDRAGSAPTAVIGYRTWQSKFASDYGILGRTIRLNGTPVTVVGIGPQQLASAFHPTLIADFWLSMSAIPSIEAGTNRAGLLERRGDFPFEVRARLRDGVSASQARAAMDVLARRLAADHPDTDPGKGITLLRTNDVVIHPREQDLWMKLISTILLTIVGLVLAIACSNLATMLLVRGTGRAKEVSVRLAVGATRWQLIRHFLTESVLLSLCGAAGGFVLSNWAIRYLASLIPIRFDMQIDYRILAFTLALSLITGIGLGLAPALRSTRVDLLPALRGESASSLSLTRGWFTLKNVLLAGQVAGSFLLLVGTAFLIRAVTSVDSKEPGFAVDGVALVSTNARYAGYSEAEAQRIYQELRRRIAAIPGVQAVFAGTDATLTSVNSREIEIDGAAGVNGNRLQVESAWGSPGYFETLQIPVLFGRSFQDSDVPGRPLVAVVNETMARRVFGSLNVVGRRFRYGGLEQSQEAKTPVEIVGVVRDIRSLEPGRGPQPTFYVPAAQAGVETSTFGARTLGDAVGLLQAMQSEIRSLDSALPVLGAQTMKQRIDAELMAWRSGVAFLGGMGGVALALASVGLYAVVRFAVSKRAVELGIRMALGAQRRQVVWLVMKEMTILIGVSIAIGSAVSLAAVAVLQSVVAVPSGASVVLPGADRTTLLLVVVLMAATAGLAAYIPARRAANADPSVSLRHQ